MLISEIIEATNGKLLNGHLDDQVSGFTQDTRVIQPGNLYIPLVGIKDGHDYIPQAFENGATATLTSHPIEDDVHNVILVEDTMKALGDLARYVRVHSNAKVVGITGSAGKTSTKDMIASVISQQYTTLKTQGNYNNNIGLPLTILRYNGEEVMVIEMGMNHLEEIDYLTKIALPDIAAITNIGTAHIGELGSRENILQAKMEIIHGMNHGTLVVNNDNDLLSTVHPEGISLKTIGIESEADLKATDIILNEDMSSFRVKVDGQDYDVRVYVPGVHFIFNALIAIQVGLLLDIPMEKCIKGIETFELTKNRNDILTLDRHIRVIDGTYNANLDSMKSSIDVLSGYAGRKIAVLGDMLELGDYEETLHRAVGAHLLKKNIDLVLTVGPAARYISDEVNKAKPGLAYHFDDNASLSAYLQECLEENDVVLVKASNGMHLKEVINDLKENN